MGHVHLAHNPTRPINKCVGPNPFRLVNGLAQSDRTRSIAHPTSSIKTITWDGLTVCYKIFYEPFTINLNFWLTWFLNNMIYTPKNRFYTLICPFTWMSFETKMVQKLFSPWTILDVGVARIQIWNFSLQKVLISYSNTNLIKSLN